MTFTTTRPVSSATFTIDAIDPRMAESILERLGYNLNELNADSDRAPTNGEISHQLHYPSLNSSFNVMGYIYCDNDIFYTNGDNNYRHAELAALELIPSHLLYDAYLLLTNAISLSNPLPSYD
jgi:hypothetical protein